MEEIAIGKIFFHDSRAYRLLREFPCHFFTKKDNKIISDKFNAWRGWLGADYVLKTQTHFLFCETIQEVEWEDVLSEKQSNDHEEHT